MKRGFRLLLRFYRRRFQDAFSEEMLATLDRVHREAEHGAKRRNFFLVREVWVLLFGIGVERVPFGRSSSRHVSRATHRFAGARFHAAEEDRARERLRALRSFGGDQGTDTKFAE